MCVDSHINLRVVFVVVTTFYTLVNMRSIYFFRVALVIVICRPIGKWGRMHREYLRGHKPIQYNCLFLSGELWTYLANLDQQAQDRLERMIDQMKAAEGITEALKASDPMAWVQRINNIRFRAEEIIQEELIYV